MQFKRAFLSVVVVVSFLTLSHEANAQSIRATRLAADQVLDTLSPYLESSFDIVIIANTATGGAANDLIPFQHARLLIKRSSNKALFKRNSAGEIIGFNESNITTLQGLPKLIPISSGKPGDGGIKTFSGIFRVNLEKSKANKTTKVEAAMSYPIFVDVIYDGRASGLAIHGTPTKNHKLLGVSRDSHGCLRTLPKYAQLIYTYLINNPENISENLPAFNQYQNLPDENVQEGGLGAREGVRALFIIFNGYNAETAGD